jgi:hypothetical protein
MGKAFWQALIVTVVLVIGIKWLTGAAFLPLLLIALLILAMSFGLSLRLERARRQS